MIGVGNVAVDVVRILAKTADELRATDVPDPVLTVLGGSGVRRIHMIGRRGPAQAKFTTKELRELGELTNAEVARTPGGHAASTPRAPRWPSRTGTYAAT